MKEQKIIVTPAYHSDFYKCQGAEEKIQPLLNEGWEIVKLTCTGKSQGASRRRLGNRKTYLYR